MFVMTVRKRKQILDSINSEIEKRHSKHLDVNEQDELKKLESLDRGILSITMTSLKPVRTGCSAMGKGERDHSSHNSNQRPSANYPSLTTS